jgi:hypothetical protein
VAWVQALQDLSGYSASEDWEKDCGKNGLSSVKTPLTTHNCLRDLLLLVESIYVPFLLANEKCIQEKRKVFSVGIPTGKLGILTGKVRGNGNNGNGSVLTGNGPGNAVLDFRQRPFKYQLKCIQKLRKDAGPALGAAIRRDKAIGSSEGSSADCKNHSSFDSKFDSSTVATIAEICSRLINGGEKAKGKL